MTPALAVSLHDVAPATWPLCERLLALTDRHHLPVTLLVVPHYHGAVRADQAPEFTASLKARVTRGDEVVLHGYHHRDEGPPPRTVTDWVERRILTAREGEFSALGEQEAALRVGTGLECLARMGLEAQGFVPPAWLMSRGAMAALRQSGLRYTCTRDRLWSLSDDRNCHAPSLVWSSRSRWRRVVSLIWNEQRQRRLRASPLLRIALHPAEGRYPAVMTHWARLLTTLTSYRRPVLESQSLDAQGH